MKTPNLDMFDPNAEQKPVRELSSPLDNYPRIEKPTSQSAKSVSRVSKPTIPKVNTLAKDARKQESKIERKQDFLRNWLDMKAAETTSFRYPPELLEKLNEVQYQLKSRHKAKATKNAILIAALAYIVWDFEKQGSDSILVDSLKNE